MNDEEEDVDWIGEAIAEVQRRQAWKPYLMREPDSCMDCNPTDKSKCEFCLLREKLKDKPSTKNWKPRCFGREYSISIDEDNTCRVCKFVDKCMGKIYKLPKGYDLNLEDIR